MVSPLAGQGVPPPGVTDVYLSVYLVRLNEVRTVGKGVMGHRQPVAQWR